MNSVTSLEIAGMIDHSLLNPALTRQEVLEGCEIAKKYHTASVCVKPCDVTAAAQALSGSDVAVSTVIGFPHGAHTTQAKLFEAEIALEQGCTELDMVTPLYWDYRDPDIGLRQRMLLPFLFTRTSPRETSRDTRRLARGRSAVRWRARGSRA